VVPSLRYLLAATAALVLFPGSGAVPSQTDIDGLPSGPVRVVMTEIDPFVVNRGGEPAGFYAEVWDDVARDLDLTYEVQWVDSFAELLPALANDAADVAVAPLAPTAEREASYDFTSAVVSSGPQLGFAERLDTRVSILRSLLDVRILWIALGATAGLLLLAHLIWLVERGVDDDDGEVHFHPTYLRGVWDGFWWATVTATTVGYGDKSPRTNAGRVLAISAMLLSLVVVGAFVSQVTSIMSERLSEPPIRSLDDVESPIGVVRESTFAAYVEDQGFLTVPFESQVDVFDAAQSGVVDVIISNPFALSASGDDHGVLAVDGVLFEEFETFGLQQGSPLREPINMVLAELLASGAIAERVASALD